MSEVGYIDGERGWVYDFDRLQLPHDVLVEYHKQANEKYGPRLEIFTLEEEERNLSLLWIIENATEELVRNGWSKRDIKDFFRNVEKEHL